MATNLERQVQKASPAAPIVDTDQRLSFWDRLKQVSPETWAATGAGLLSHMYDRQGALGAGLSEGIGAFMAGNKQDEQELKFKHWLFANSNYINDMGIDPEMASMIPPDQLMSAVIKNKLSGPADVTPYSGSAKIMADLQHGLISPEMARQLLQHELQGADGGPQWVQKVTPEGVSYLYNVKTGDIKRDPLSVATVGKPMTGDAAARFALATEGSAALEDVRKAIIKPDGTIDRGAVFSTYSDMGSKGIRNALNNAIGNRIRIESGANVTDPEFARNTQRFLPNPTDSDETIRRKLETLQSYFDEVQKTMGPKGMTTGAASGSLPEGIPAGSELIQTNSDGSEYYKTPDGQVLVYTPDQ